jgi:hypothetical protein
LPINGSDETLGLDSFVGGPTELSSLLVVVRPVRTLFKQYRISDEGGALLRAAATDGIVTALRVRVESEAGEPVTLLGVFTSRKQVQDLAGLPTSHGILASICETCSWFPNWSHYWAPALMRATHTVRLVDLPRRLWLDGLEAEGAPPNCRGFTIGKDADQSGLAGLFIWFDDHYAPADPPLLVVGSQRTVAAISSALGALFGSDVFSAGQPPEWEKTMVLVRRLVEAEPWFDARSLEDLPDFAKMGDLYQRAALIAQG